MRVCVPQIYVTPLYISPIVYKITRTSFVHRNYVEYMYFSLVILISKNVKDKSAVVIYTNVLSFTHSPNTAILPLLKQIDSLKVKSSFKYAYKQFKM